MLTASKGDQNRVVDIDQPFQFMLANTEGGGEHGLIITWGNRGTVTTPQVGCTRGSDLSNDSNDAGTETRIDVFVLRNSYRLVRKNNNVVNPVSHRFISVAYLKPTNQGPTRSKDLTQDT